MSSFSSSPYSSLFTKTADPRVNELDLVLKKFETLFSEHSLNASHDLLRINNLKLTQNNNLEPLWLQGLVVHSFAGIGWYKVQASHGHGIISCCTLEPTALQATGPRNLRTYPPGTSVLVCKPKGSLFGIIVGCLPSLGLEEQIPNKDWIWQGSNLGFKKEEISKFILRNFSTTGDIQVFDNYRPLDSLSTDQGILTGSGLGLLIDDYSLQLRVNEICGLWATYFDSWLGLYAHNYDHVTAVLEEKSRNDEGELFYHKKIYTYPWESFGAENPTTEIFKTYTDQEVQYEKPVSKIDVKEENQDLVGAARKHIYEGFLGRGGLEFVVKPQFSSDQLRHEETGYDEGLYRKSIGLDGSLLEESAAGIHHVKRVLLPVPVPIKKPEDGRGDDLRKTEYGFSNYFNTKNPYTVPAAKTTVETCDDFLTYRGNWFNLFPFYYHKKDFSLPEVQDTRSVFTTQQVLLDFTQITEQGRLDAPSPKSLYIDHIHKDVDYYETTSVISQLPDGDIVIKNGYGAAIYLTKGQIHITAPDGIFLNSGKTAVVSSNQVIVKSHDGLDLSSAQGSVRIKAENHCEILSGNSGQGALILENRANEQPLNYEKFGDWNRGCGIILKAQNSYVSSFALGQYHGTKAKDFVIDVADSFADFVVQARQSQAYLKEASATYLGYSRENQEIINYFSLAIDKTIFSNSVVIQGSLDLIQGAGEFIQLQVQGDIQSTGDISSGGVVRDSRGDQVSKIPDGFKTQLSSALTDKRLELQQGKDLGFTLINQILLDLYGENRIANRKVLEEIGFSYRDFLDQYRTENLELSVPYWSQLLLTGQATGGQLWQETPVTCRGQQLYPWPGRRAWLEEKTAKTIFSLELSENGIVKERGNAYQNKESFEVEKTTLSKTTFVL